MRGGTCRLLLASVIIVVLLYHTWTGHSLLRGGPSRSLGAATPGARTESLRTRGRAHRGIKIKVRKRQGLSDPVAPVHVTTLSLRAASEVAARARSDPAAMLTDNQRLGNGAAAQGLLIGEHPRSSGGQGNRHAAGRVQVHVHSGQQAQRAEGEAGNAGARGSLHPRAASEGQGTEQRPASLQAGGAVGTWGLAVAQQALRQQDAAQGQLPGGFQATRAPWDERPAPLPPPGQSCEAWLLSADAVAGARNFSHLPVTVMAGAEETLEGCGVPCRMTTGPTDLTAPVEGGALVPAYDAHFGQLQVPHVAA